METAAFLDRLRQHQAYKDQIVHIEHVHPRMARYGELDRELHPDLRQALEGAGFPRLYIHQAQAINAALAGRNAFVVTPSASGKAEPARLFLRHTGSHIRRRYAGGGAGRG